VASSKYVDGFGPLCHIVVDTEQTVSQKQSQVPTDIGNETARVIDYILLL
jgi:hypothetical protein